MQCKCRHHVEFLVCVMLISMLICAQCTLLALCLCFLSCRKKLRLIATSSKLWG